MNWKFWKFATVPEKEWDSKHNRKKYFDWLSDVLGVKTSEDWHKFGNIDINRRGGSTVLRNHYDLSICKALEDIYPQFRWMEWLFPKVPSGYWIDQLKQTEYLLWIAEVLEIKVQEDWYKIRTKDLRTFPGGARLLHYYSGSLIKALQANFPNYNWKPWFFANVPQRHWKNVANIKQYFHWLEAEFDINEPDDWYKVKLMSVYEKGGERVLSSFRHAKYGDSLIHALKVVYPERNWQFWKFSPIPAQFWDDKQNQQIYFDWLSNELGIKQPNDWTRVTGHEIKRLKGEGLIHRYGGLERFIGHFCPEFLKVSNDGPPSKGQGLLHTTVKEAFPDTEVLMTYKHPEMKFSNMNAMELDVFLPAMSLALEYHGRHHFEDTEHFGSFEQFKLRDQEKRNACQRLGITLIEVPFWWDHLKESLIATLHKSRPDLIKDPGPGVPIPETMPPEFANLKIW